MSNGRRRIYLAVPAVLAGALITYLAITSLDEPLGFGDRKGTLAASTQQGLGAITIVTLGDGRLAGGASYRISPDPFTGGGNHTVYDGESGTDSSSVSGIITIEGIPDGTYSVIQLVGPDGEQRDLIPRILTVANSSSTTVTFIAGTLSDDTEPGRGTRGFGNIESISYAAKFECGTIRGAEGPLRPGHYDTDIGIFNRQDFSIKVTWTAAASDKPATNAILKTLDAQTPSNIVCSDIRVLVGGEDEFIEGFVIIEVPVDPRLQASLVSGAGVLGSDSSESLDILDVQAFYTANALEELPHPVLVDKIAFIITSKATIDRLPDSMMDRVLDVTLPSELDKISDPVEKVKSHLSQNFNLTGQDLANIRIEIISVEVGVGTMIDDHAISLSKVLPRAKSQ